MEFDPFKMVEFLPAKRAGRFDWDKRNRMDTSGYPKPEYSEYRQGLTRQQWRRGEQLDAKEDRSIAKLQKAEEKRIRALRGLRG